MFEFFPDIARLWRNPSLVVEVYCFTRWGVDELSRTLIISQSIKYCGSSTYRLSSSYRRNVGKEGRGAHGPRDLLNVDEDRSLFDERDETVPNDGCRPNDGG